MPVDVVVVGAGYAGLAAARSLSRLGVDAVVLEGQGRLGGRVHTDRAGLAPLDLGGQWVGPGQDRVLAAASDLRLSTFRSHSAGTSLLVDGGRSKRLTLAGMVPLLPAVAASLPGLVSLLVRARRWATDTVSAPPRSLGHDAVTVAEWMARAIPSPCMRRVIAATVRDSFCAEPEEISLLAATRGIADSGGLAAALGFDGGAQQDLFTDGADRIPQLWAEHLDVRTGQTVREITRTRDGTVHVRAAECDEPVMASHAIIAIPPHQVLRIAFDPALPARYWSWLRGQRMGRVIKMFAIYPAPFWRDAGLSGTALLTTGPMSLTADVSPPGGPGHLCILASGHDADTLTRLTPAQRRHRIVDALVGLLGPAAAHPIRWIEKAWTADPWACGGYSALPTPGTIANDPHFRWPPLSRISWAGTETSTTWGGYIEGAIRSGERAAAQALTALTR